MQKKILLLTIILILLTGCVKIDKNNQDYSKYVVNSLKDKSITNNVALGYKYYLPRGVKKIKDYDYNQKFLVGDTYLYMFVDINSYYYKSKLKKDSDTNDYYYQQISYDGKTGYIKITKKNDKYFIKLLYNYAKIEFYSDYDNINKLLTISSIILNSVDYNKKVIEKVVDESLGSSKEFTYEIEKPIDASNNFSQYLEEYVTEESEEEELPDE